MCCNNIPGLWGLCFVIFSHVFSFPEKKEFYVTTCFEYAYFHSQGN